MNAYGSKDLAGLAEQLLRGPKRLRLRQLSSIEFLMTVVEEGKSYPFDFIRHALTGYRPAASDDAGTRLLDGVLVRRDLVALAEELSEDAELRLETWPQRISCVSELAVRLHVSSKTIFRWRRRGLVGWRFMCGDRRTRLMFPEQCVRRFVASHEELVNRGGSFSQLSAEERSQIVARARELVAAGERTANAVARVLANQTNRAVETIRLLLKQHEETHPQTPLFPRGPLALAPDDCRIAVWEAYQDGASLETLAQQHGRDVAWVYAVVTEMRARTLHGQPIEYVASLEFDTPEVVPQILDDPVLADPYDHSAIAAHRVPRDLPPYLQQLFTMPLLTPTGERALFRKLNYLRYAADRQRAALVPETATARELDALEDLLSQAAAVKNQIVQANLRLVVSIAKRHASPQVDFFEVVSDGNVSLMRAVDKFDYTRGFKFSTYASWAIMKNFARTLPERRQHGDRFQTGRDELLVTVASPPAEEHDERGPVVRRVIERMLDALDEREQTILRQRFGLDVPDGPQTLEQIGRRMGVSKERVRQIESRAMSKLRVDFAADAAKALGN